jgi:hypothetical protein
MSDALESDAQLEIGHVLFMDIVGFSKLLVDQPSAVSKRLNKIVRNTAQFRAAESAGKLMRTCEQSDRRESIERPWARLEWKRRLCQLSYYHHVFVAVLIPRGPRHFQKSLNVCGPKL